MTEQKDDPFANERAIIKRIRAGEFTIHLPERPEHEDLVDTMSDIWHKIDIETIEVKHKFRKACMEILNVGERPEIQVLFNHCWRASYEEKMFQREEDGNTIEDRLRNVFIWFEGQAWLFNQGTLQVSMRDLAYYHPFKFRVGEDKDDD